MTRHPVKSLPPIGKDGIVADDFPSRADAYCAAFDCYAPLLKKMGVPDRLLRVRRSGDKTWAVYLVDSLSAAGASRYSATSPS